MASLKDLRRRIKSIKSIQQVTKAMEMVAAAKLRRAQTRAQAVQRFEKDWLAFMDQSYPEVVHNVRTHKTISDADQLRLEEAVKVFKTQFKA